MKYLKTYENINEPIIGDYVICIPDNLIKNSEYFFNNAIGKIIKKAIITRKEYSYGVEYENIPKFIQEYYCALRKNADGTQYQENIIWFERDMIEYYSKSIEEIKMKMKSGKYNL